jgi:hypothetical protein
MAQSIFKFLQCFTINYYFENSITIKYNKVHFIKKLKKIENEFEYKNIFYIIYKMKFCTNCKKTHRNRVTTLCNDCRVKKEYPICTSCNIHHIYHNNFTVCRMCFKFGLPKDYQFIEPIN